jgi:hypothetical protein
MFIRDRERDKNGLFYLGGDTWNYIIHITGIETRYPGTKIQLESNCLADFLP